VETGSPLSSAGAPVSPFWRADLGSATEDAVTKEREDILTVRKASTFRPERLLLVLAVVALGYCVWSWCDAGAYQARQGFRLGRILDRVAESWRGSSGEGAAARTRHEAAQSGLIGRIEIPSLGISAIVAEGTDATTLRRAVGHLKGSALPGEEGNVVLAGHRDSFFRGLRNARPGDRIRLTTPDGVFAYRVDSEMVVGGSRTDLLAGNGSPVLTLVTCYPFNYLGPAPERWIVRALPEDAPDGPVASVRSH
jgi:sortase A